MHMAEIVNNDPPGFVVHKIPFSFVLNPYVHLSVLYCESCICCVVSVEKPNISYLIKDFLFPLKPFLI